jgi:DNA-binding XRE family transcriptional regulator
MPFEKIDVNAITDEELKKDEFNTSYEVLKKEYDLIDQIIRIRKSMKITQTQLARSTNVSQQTIARLEKEKRFPKFDTLMKIIGGLGLKLTITER